MIPKTQTNVPGSRPSLSFKSIMKDLQDLSENVATKNEVTSLEAKMTKLEKENQEMKADLLVRETELKAADKKRKLYYNLFHENVKVVAELKAENEYLKAEIGALKSSLNEENKFEEFPTSSILSMIPVKETDSDLIQNQQPPLAICEGSSDGIEMKKSGSTRFTTKRRYCDDDKNMITNNSKKRSTQILPPYGRPQLFEFFQKKWGKTLSLRAPPRLDEN